MTLIEYCASVIAGSYDFQRFDKRWTREAVVMLLTAFPNRFLKYNDTVVVFLRLSDSSFSSLKKGELDLTNPKVLLPLFKEEGFHTHVISCVSNSVRDMLFLGDYLKDKSLSWFRPDMSKLIVHERS